jgi:hypothetical protein
VSRLRRALKAWLELGPRQRSGGARRRLDVTHKDRSNTRKLWGGKRPKRMSRMRRGRGRGSTMIVSQDHLLLPLWSFIRPRAKPLASQSPCIPQIADNIARCMSTQISLKITQYSLTFLNPLADRRSQAWSEDRFRRPMPSVAVIAVIQKIK